MAIDGLHLLRPDALWLWLLVLPATALLWRVARAAGDWTRAIDPELLPFMLEGNASKVRHRGTGLLALALMVAVVAIAGPSLRKIDVPVFQRADALVIVLDLSASMQAADIQPSRVQRARQKILDLLAERNEGVTGLVVYAGDAHVVAPLTDDRRTIENLLPALHPDIMPLPGSDAAAAIQLATGLLGAAGVANGQILLMTDGMPKFDPDDVRAELESANAELSILGIGTDSGAPIPRAGGGFVRRASGDIVIPTLNAAELSGFAASLNGRFAPVSLDNSDIDSLTRVLLDNDSGEIQLDRKTDTWLDQGNWLALLLALAMLPLFRRGALVLLVCPWLLLASPSEAANTLWQRADQQAAAALAQGETERAAELFEDPAWRGTAQFSSGDFASAARSFSEQGDADGLYNLGNALAMQGDYAGALEAYERSLTQMPEREDAIQNRDLMKQLLEQQEQENEQENEDPSNSDDNQQSEDSDESQSQNESDNASDPSDDASSGQDGNQSQQNSSPPEDNPPEQSPAESQPPVDDSAYEQSLADQTEAQMNKFDQALEKQQALEQWLRRVPDDPGGLLQRKFRYESIQRLRRGEEPDDEIRW